MYMYIDFFPFDVTILYMNSLFLSTGLTPPPTHTTSWFICESYLSLIYTHKPSVSNLNSGEQKGLYYTYKKGSVTMLLNSSVIYTCTE